MGRARLLGHMVGIVALIWPTFCFSQITQADLPLGDGANPYAVPVARMVGSIIEYTRWPTETPVVRLCVVGPADHADQVQARPLSRGRSLRRMMLATGSPLPDSCDVVYIGRLSLPEQRRLADSLAGRAVLTIAENDPACRSRAMVCLLFEADGLSFRINLDSLSRSQVRIDPRVLRMGAEERAPG